MRHRIFIAINLPENIRKKLAGFEAEWPSLPARWTKGLNLHITLIFLGYLNDEELLEVCRLTKKAAERNPGFQVAFTKICYGPAGKTPPRMVWAVGKKSPEFSILRDDLEKTFLQSEKVSFSREEKSFSPHITLARIRRWDWRKIEPEERLNIDKDVSLVFDVDSIEVMESESKKGGPVYTIIESHNLKT